MSAKKSEKPMEEAMARAALAVSETAKDAAKLAEPTVRAARKKLKVAAKKAEPAVKAAQEALQDAAKKAEPAVKAAQEALQDAAKKAEPMVEAAKETLQDAGEKASALRPEVFVQWGGREVSCTDLLTRAKKDYRAAHKGAVRTCRVYLKPEDGAAYYVINGEEGKIDL